MSKFSKTTTSPKVICYVVCYKDPNYIRTLTLLSALQDIPNTKIIVVKNKSKNLLRYIEVPIKLLIARLKHSPELFIIGFRGDEIFWLFYPAMVGKKKIFDEFVNIHDWFINEHHKFTEKSLSAKLLDTYMRWVISRCQYVLTDTKLHAQLCAQVYKIPLTKIKYIPVAADEAIFYPRQIKGHKSFEIFFYGNLLPLHGLDVLLKAMSNVLNGRPDVHFTLAGGIDKPEMLRIISNFIKTNRLQQQVKHLPWVEYKELPKYIANADLCLGGPFGNTGQAKRVISGKSFQFLAMDKATVVGNNKAHEHFINGRNCLTVKLGNPNDLIRVVNWAINNKDKLNSIGIEGKKLYKQHYSINVVKEKLIQII